MPAQLNSHRRFDFKSQSVGRRKYKSHKQLFREEKEIGFHSRWIHATFDGHWLATVVQRTVKCGRDLARHPNLGEKAHGIGPPDLDVHQRQLMKPLDVFANIGSIRTQVT